ncbi:uncharacterized protein CXQ87_004546 [Candidozyma duobushaemuli]|nr:uncharacterized protein CXQ87_004546 [[Candida] duobushaemulonis]PVH16988.1 hypothetical protein CXQ87_004546 [[Candida] duobushaemulonis]
MEKDEEAYEAGIEAAISRFKKKDYSRCLGLLNELVSHLQETSPSEITKIRKYYNLTPRPLMGVPCHPRLLSVLDHRAATYEKLGNLPRALKDAQKAMALDPLDPKGYLRAAKLWGKEGKDVDAYKALQRGIYTIERALEKHDVPISQNLLNSLRTKYAELNRQLKRKRSAPEVSSKKPTPEESIKKAKSFSASGLQRKLDEMLPLPRSSSAPQALEPRNIPKSTSDPLERLPVDVIEQIFSYLPVRSLLRSHLVCKDWYALLTSMPSLYSEVFSLRHRVTAPEYFGGLKLMKKVSQYSYQKSICSVKLWSTYDAIHLGRILENIVSDETLKLRKLEIVNRDFSWQLLLNKLEKCKWKLENLSTIEKLRFVINRPLINPQLLLHLYPQLTELDLVVADEVANIPYDTLTPTSDIYKKFLSESSAATSSNSLKGFSYINHETYIDIRPLAQPQLLKLRFPALTRLTLVGVNFKNATHEFGEFVSCCDQLESLYLEKNDQLPIRTLLRLLQLFEAKFKLKRLTIREEGESRHSNLNDVEEDSLPCLSELEHLDIYGSSLSSKGLLKLLTIANAGFKLSSLNLGKSRFVFFRRDQFVTGHEVLDFSSVFQIAPHLQTLYLNEMDIDNLSMKLLHNDLANACGYDNIKLKKLDLSFCQKINGIGIMNLLNFSSSQPSSPKTLNLDELILDGLDIHKGSINLLMNKEIVKLIRNDPTKTTWKQKGVNTLEP